MNKLKILTLFLVAYSMTFTLTSCGDDEVNPTDNNCTTGNEADFVGKYAGKYEIRINNPLTPDPFPLDEIDTLTISSGADENDLTVLGKSDLLNIMDIEGKIASCNTIEIDIDLSVDALPVSATDTLYDISLAEGSKITLSENKDKIDIVFGKITIGRATSNAAPFNLIPSGLLSSLSIQVKSTNAGFVKQ